jgi:ParB/RepB/Spo0J family partition protein
VLAGFVDSSGPKPTATPTRASKEELAMNSNNDQILRIPASKLLSWPDQPRQIFTGIDALSRCIGDLGQVLPLVVRKVWAPADTYQIIDGERRFRAGIAAKLTEFLCVVRDLDDRAAYELSRRVSETAVPFHFLDKIRQVDFYASEKGGKLTKAQIAEKHQCSERLVERRQTILGRLSKDGKAEAIRIVEGRPAPSTSQSLRSLTKSEGEKSPTSQSLPSSTKSQSESDATDWQLNEQQLYDVSAIPRPEGQVAALRLIEKLQLEGGVASKAIAWCAAGKDPSQFGAKDATNGPKSTWDPSIADGGLAGKLPPTVSARSGAGGKCTVSFKSADHFAALIAGAGLDALNQALSKIGRGDPNSPFHAALPKLIDDAAIAEETKAKQPAAKNDAPRKADARSLQRLETTKGEEAKAQKVVESNLELVYGKGNDDLAEVTDIFKKGDLKEVTNRLNANAKAFPRKAALVKTAVESVKKLGAFRKEIERLTKKVAAQPPATPDPTIEERSQGLKDAGMAMAAATKDPEAAAKLKAAAEALKEGLGDLGAMAEMMKAAQGPATPTEKKTENDAKDTTV